MPTIDPSLGPSFPSAPNWGPWGMAVFCSLSPQHSNYTIKSSVGLCENRGWGGEGVMASFPRLAAERTCGLLRTDPDTCRGHLSSTPAANYPAAPSKEANEAHTAHPHSLAVTRTRMPVIVAGAPGLYPGAVPPGPHGPGAFAFPSVQHMGNVACGSL